MAGDFPFSRYMQAQLATIKDYITTRRSLGDTRDDDTLATIWIERNARQFRERWDAGLI